MVILTNCLNEKSDEGCLNVANSLIKRMKAQSPETTVISYENRTAQSDLHMELNKLFGNPGLFRFLKKKKQPVLYIPFSSNTTASIVRTWMLALFSGCKIYVLFVLRHPMNGIFRKILQWSKATIITLSQESYQFFQSELKNETRRIKAGVDVQKFVPVEPERKVQLRKRYGIGEHEKVLLHVGHLKEGRNLRALLNTPDDYRLILVISTLQEQDQQLRQQLQLRPNTLILDTYQEHIEQIYQISDVYVFPVLQAGNCIDVPLSALEAAACGIPVVATDYGELKELMNKDGFVPITSFDAEPFGALLDRVCQEKTSGRQSVLEYDWNVAVKKLLECL